MADTVIKYDPAWSSGPAVRKVNLSDQTSLGGNEFYAAILVNEAGAEIALATSVLQTTANGLLTTIDGDTGAIALNVASLDTKTPALGQALEAASVPVVLTAAQISTLTPPAAITGFATEAKQPALGTAGTAASDVLTVQGIASMTALKVDGSGVTQPVSGSVTANIGTVGTLATAAKQDTGNTALGAIQTAVETIQTAQLPDGHNVTVDNASIAVTGTFWQATQPVSGTVTAAQATAANLNATVVGTGTFAVQAAQSGTWNITNISGTVSLPTGASTLSEQQSQTTLLGNIDTDTGFIANSAQNIETYTNQSLAELSAINGNITACDTGNIAGTVTIGTSVTPGTGATHLGKAEDAAHASGDVGVMALAVRQDTASQLADTDGDYSPLITDASGRLHVNVGNTVTVASHAVTNAGTFATQDDARASGGESTYSFLSTAAVQAAEIKGSAGTVYSMQFFNINAAARYVRLYDQTGAPASTDGANIVWRGMIPGNTAATGFVVHFPKGKAFSTGIGIRVSAAIADNDTTVLAANEVVGNVGYK